MSNISNFQAIKEEIKIITNNILIKHFEKYVECDNQEKINIVLNEILEKLITKYGYSLKFVLTGMVFGKESGLHFYTKCLYHPNTDGFLTIPYENEKQYILVNVGGIIAENSYEKRNSSENTFEKKEEDKKKNKIENKNENQLSETKMFFFQDTFDEMKELKNEINEYQDFDKSGSKILLNQINEELNSPSYTLDSIKKCKSLIKNAKHWIEAMKREKIKKIENENKKIKQELKMEIRQKKEIEKNYGILLEKRKKK